MDHAACHFTDAAVENAGQLFFGNDAEWLIVRPHPFAGTDHKAFGFRDLGEQFGKFARRSDLARYADAFGDAGDHGLFHPGIGHRVFLADHGRLVAVDDCDRVAHCAAFFRPFAELHERHRT